jgi:hypothetical protein
MEKLDATLINAGRVFDAMVATRVMQQAVKRPWPAPIRIPVLFTYRDLFVAP